MNIVVVSEGKAEKHIFKSWIPLINPVIQFVDRIRDINQNNFTIIASFGYPSYFQDIDQIIEDINSHGGINRFIISVDSENMTFSDKYDEISNYVAGKTCSAQIHIVIQHFCIETWALGNCKVCPIAPSDPVLVTFKNFFNVRDSDPELLPAYPPLQLNRAQFSEKYLDTILKCRNPHLKYAKGKPSVIATSRYFEQIKHRHIHTHHISSFGTFLSAFK